MPKRPGGWTFPSTRIIRVRHGLALASLNPWRRPSRCPTGLNSIRSTAGLRSYSVWRTKRAEDIVVRRRFPQALDGAAVYFSPPHSGRANEDFSEAMIAEFGIALIQRTPGFRVYCFGCSGKGTTGGVPCAKCDGLGATRPRFFSNRGGHHDYIVLATDEDGLAYWGSVRSLPYDPASGRSKYISLSSSRAMEASVSGLARYHVAGMKYPAASVVLTEGTPKAEESAYHLRQRCIGLPGTAFSADSPTAESLLAMLKAWGGQQRSRSPTTATSTRRRKRACSGARPSSSSFCSRIPTFSPSNGHRRSRRASTIC
jgi:hypothetical protein